MNDKNKRQDRNFMREILSAHMNGQMYGSQNIPVPAAAQKYFNENVRPNLQDTFTPGTGVYADPARPSIEKVLLSEPALVNFPGLWNYINVMDDYIDRLENQLKKVQRRLDLCAEQNNRVNPYSVLRDGTINLSANDAVIPAPEDIQAGKEINHSTTQPVHLTGKIPDDLQKRIKYWMIRCFGESAAEDTQERAHRLLEECFELVQSLGCSKEEIIQLMDYVYSRPVGLPVIELPQVSVTLYCLACALKIDLKKGTELELIHINEKIDKIREKWHSKPKGYPLPGQYKPNK